MTEQELLKANFLKEKINNITVYRRDNSFVTYVDKLQVWASCRIYNNEVKITDIYINTIEQLEQLIIETKIHNYGE